MKISIFRRQFADLLLGINTQFGLLAHRMGHLADAVWF